MRQGLAGAPGSVARTGIATVLGGRWPRCFDSTGPGAWPRQAQVGHLPQAPLQAAALGARAAAVPTALHRTQLGRTLSLGLSPAPEDTSFLRCMGLLQRSPLPARASSSGASPGRCHGPTARWHCVGPVWGAKGLRRLGLVFGEGAASPPLSTSGFNKGCERPEHS